MSEPAEQTPLDEGNDVTVTYGEQTETLDAGDNAPEQETPNAEQTTLPDESEANATPLAGDTAAETKEPEAPEDVQATYEPESEHKEADHTAEVEAPSVSRELGSALNKEEYERQIRENEALQAKLASALSNQEAERDSYRKLTEQNGKLQKHYDDMKEKYEDMHSSHTLLLAEIESYKKVNDEQKHNIANLQSEVKMLKDTQGGDDNIRALQEKLIRLSDDQEQKDRTIHSLQGELDATRERLKDAEARAARSGANNTAPKSKTCAIM